MDKIRVIRFEYGDAFFNMALDEAIMRAVGGGMSPPTLRIYGWDPPAVSVGYFQELKEEIDLEFCHDRKIQMVRRLSGGGAVLHTPKELTYSFSVRVDDPLVPQDVQGSYMKICAPIVSALRKLGVEANFRPINDIEVARRKVSGSAQTRRFGAVLQHGTILLGMDYSLLPALKTRPEKLAEKGVRDVRDRITTIGELLRREVKQSEFEDLLIRSFAAHFQASVEETKLCGMEELIPALEERYKSAEWTFRR
ncbi:MAG: biotin/lipoate A/B protein ligase family protein [Candidatus Verstraetearchaeota archaeon]|nr:biotin/lipoate A/B protein ligase family protein [Candidatus Verstraetearchaeota archaeon]